MNVAWFHVPGLEAGSDVVPLPEQEAHHAVRVRRIRDGDEVVVFDGYGLWAQGRLETGRGSARVRTIRFHEPAPERPAIHLCAALPKGERFSTMLGMIAQLGVSSFSPLICEHTVVRPRDAHARRAQRIFIEACKQSRNPWLPHWGSPQHVGELGDHDGTLLFAHPGKHARPVAFGLPDELTLVVGPEAGLTTLETHTLERSDAVPVSLGNRTLRIETAAVVLVTVARTLARPL